MPISSRGNFCSKFFLFALIVLSTSTFLPSLNISNSKLLGKPALEPQRADGIPWQTYYVSPSGDDTANGTEAYPYKTLYRAQEAVRVNVSAGLLGDVVVYLRAGTHLLNQTFLLNQSDCGNNGFRVSYLAYPNESPVISGGKTVTGWSLYGNGIWVATCDVDDFRQLYVNGQRAVRARGDPIMIKSTDGDGHLLNDLSIASWNNIKDVEIVYKTVWTLPRIHIASIDTDLKRINMQYPAYGIARTHLAGVRIEEPTWIENAFELLDQPGEWYFNRTNDCLYYKPLPNENMLTAKVIVPVLETLMQVNGSRAQKVENLDFQGLSFQHGSWLKPNEYGVGFVDMQANVCWPTGVQGIDTGMTPGNVICKFAQNVTFENCTFTHLGATGLDLQEGVAIAKIQGCTFLDISGSGLQVGETSHPNYAPEDNGTVRDIAIINNYVTNCCREYMGGIGIYAALVRNVRIEHNTISNQPYTGISVGWAWEDYPTVCGNNSIKFNHIYGVMTYLYDGAGIYTLGRQPGTNVSYNVIHDSGYNGLYADQGTTNTTWSNNVVYHTWNVILDHTLEVWTENVMENNYFDVTPDQTWGLPKERITYQIWDVGPGSTGFPQYIVDMAGVKASYKHLIPSNEWYWKFEPEPMGNTFWADPFVFWSIIGGIVVLGIVGMYLIGRRSTISEKKREVE